MKVQIRMRQSFVRKVIDDLSRAHPVAAERVGFVYASAAVVREDLTLLFPSHFDPVADDDYLDGVAAATISTRALRHALGTAASLGQSCFHVHCHHGGGEPWFSSTDITLIDEFTPALLTMAPHVPHGGIVFNGEGASALMRTIAGGPLLRGRVSIAGRPLWMSPTRRTEERQS